MTRTRDSRILGLLKKLFVAAALCSLIAFATISYKGYTLDAESKKYVEAAITAMAEDWNKEELVNRATPELKGMFRPDQLNGFFGNLRQLGRLVKYEGTTGEAIMWFHLDNGNYDSSASYTAKAEFEHGNAVFKVTLLKRNGAWLINEFRVNASTPLKKKDVTT